MSYFLTEGRDSSQNIAAFFLSQGSICHSDPLESKGSGKPFQVEMSTDWDNTNNSFQSGISHQGLIYTVGIYPQLLGGFDPVSLIHMVRGMPVLMGSEINV